MSSSAASFFKATFREAAYKYGDGSIYRTADSGVPVALDPIKKKWVYVFAKAKTPEPPFYLFAEIYCDENADFYNINLDKEREKDKRQAGTAKHTGFYLPLAKKGERTRLYACVSQIQLPWERVYQLEMDPSLRCYLIGDTIGGVTLAPNQASQDIYDFIGGKKPETTHDTIKSCVIVGLFDYLEEAKRRSDKYKSACDEYLKVRYDTERPDFTKEQMERRRMKKYAAALIYNSYLTKNPDAEEYRKCLKRNGWELEEYLNQENKYEWDIKTKAEQAGADLAGWLSSNAFEGALLDYSVSEKHAENWQLIEGAYFAIMRRYSTTSMMAKYFHDSFDDEKSWMKEYLFNEDRFEAYREPTEAAAEFLGNMSEYVIKDVSLEKVPEFLTKHARIWFREASVEWADNSVELAKTTYLTSLASGNVVKTRKLTLVKKVVENEAIKKVVESKALNALLVGLDVIDLGIAAKDASNKFNVTTALNAAVSLSDFSAAIFEISKKVGAGPIAGLGAISGGTDAFLSIMEGRDEWKEGKGHYDEAVDSFIKAGGLGISSVGYAWITGAAAMGAIDAGESFLTYGIGMSAAALGVPVAGWLIAAGMVITAAGEVLYFSLHKEGVKKWLVESEWGDQDALVKAASVIGLSPKSGVWNFDTSPDYRNRIAQLNEFVYTVESNTWYTKLNNTATVRFKSPYFTGTTRIVIEEFAIEADNKQKETIIEDFTVRENSLAPNVTVDVEKVSDVMCNVDVNFKHHSNLPNVSKVISKAKIDLFGNNEIVFETVGIDKNLIG